MAGLAGKSLRDEKLVEEVVDSMMGLPGLTILPLKLKDVTYAVELMREYGLEYEDALHLATALRSRVREIISNDEDFDKTPLKRVFM